MNERTASGIGELKSTRETEGHTVIELNRTVKASGTKRPSARPTTWHPSSEPCV